MAARRIRTYKLQLSEAGLALYLACHHRTAILSGTFAAYGITLSVAIEMLSWANQGLVGDILASPHCRTLAGPRIYFVGAPSALAAQTMRIRARLPTDARLRRPSAAAIHRAALIHFKRSEDASVQRALHTLASDGMGAHPH